MRLRTVGYIILLLALLYLFTREAQEYKKERDKRRKKEEQKEKAPPEVDFPLEKGDEGPLVEELQRRINRMNTWEGGIIYPIEEDGYFGEQTEKGAHAFNLLTEKDRVTEETFDSIEF